MKELIDCIEESQGLGLELIKAYDQYLEKVKDLKSIDTLILVGSGSSYNSALMTKSFIEEKLKVKVELFYPNDFLNYTNYSLRINNSIVMFISQGGQTNLVIEAANRMKDLGVYTVAVTENAQSKIAEITDLVLDINTGIEAYMYRTIGVTNTVLSILLFMIAKAEQDKIIDKNESEYYLNELQDTFIRFKDVIEFSKEWYQKEQLVLKNADSIIFSAAGSYWPIAKEADIKFMEMLPLLTNSFELEELVHGPQNMFEKSHVFFLIADKDTDLEKAKSIKKFLSQEVLAEAYLINEENYDIFTSNSEFKSFLYLIFFQVIAYYTSKDRGRDLSQGIYPKVNEYVKTSI